MASTGTKSITDEGAHYWAFLSYSHADQATATKLHKALEGYTLPAAVRKTHGLPRRLIPVFLDLEELEAASALSARLEEALDRSRWLLVLCTPAAAKSRYVNEEVEYFIGKHGAKRVLCVLAEGEPAESFPPAIKAFKDEPLAADLRKEFGLGVLRIVAAMAMVGFTALRNREAQRRRRQRLAVAAISGLVALGGFAWWDLFQREHVDYYTNYVRRHGIWEGVDKLSADEASHRNATYRFVRNGRLHPPRRVDDVNGSGYCLGEGLAGLLGSPNRKAFGLLRERYCTIRFDYREDGALARETWQNNTGQPLDVVTYTEDGLAQFTQQGFASAGTYTGIYYVQATRDERGYDRKIRFLHSLGNPRQNEQHEFGWALDYDDFGRVIRRSVLDDHGQPIGPIFIYRYDSRGLPIETRNTDLNGELQAGVEGYATRLVDYDRHGNPVHERYLLPDGTPALATIPAGWLDFPVAAVSVIASEWDERGNLIEWRQLDGHDRPVNNQLGFSFARMTYDERGNRLRIDLLDRERKPPMARVTDSGAASLISKFDDNNYEVETLALGNDGQPVPASAGPAVIRRHFDERRRRYHECYFDGSGKPVLTLLGACYEWSFNERGVTVGIDFFGLDGKLRARPDTGSAHTVIVRDDRDNVIAGASYGADLKPVINHFTKRSAYENTLDDEGNRIEIRSYDTEHRLMKDEQGVAVLRRKYDRFGQVIEETYFDEHRRPVRNKLGLFGFRAAFDSRGRRARKEFIDAIGGPTKLASIDAFGERYEFDVVGHVSADIYLARDGSDAGRLERTHDEYGHEIEDRYFGRDGAPAAHPGTGCAVERFSYDSYGRAIEKRCLDARKKPVNRKDGGWAVEKITPSVSGVDDEKYFDASGKPVTPKKT